MTIRLSHLLFFTAALGAVVAAGLAVAGADNGALAVIAISLGVLSAAVAAALRHLGVAVEGTRVLAEGIATANRDLAAQLERKSRGSFTATDRKNVERIDRRTEQIYARAVRLGTAVERVPSETVNIGRFQSELAPGLASMPALGGWAASAPSVLFLLETVLSADRPPLVVECGSGTSTVWIATALRHRGDGQVIALEHDTGYADQCRRDLARHGLTDRATVVHAPLVEHDTSLGPVPWYDTAGIADLAGITLLFVDGPPGDTTHHARRPAFELLAKQLADGALVVLDDTDRAEEQEVLEAWVAEPVAGRRMEVVTQVGRSTVLRVTAT